ncbi:MAG: Uncharacterised protein [Owenweeksia sp. TMED14]|nr:MAG: Uncharacterised protein [Owenweeksia sp. TMED14]
MRQLNTWLIWSFVLLILQSFIINKIQLYGFLNPYLYVGIFLLAPSSISKFSLVLIGASVGAWLDFQLLTGGIHLMASSLLCYLKPGLLDFVVPRADEDSLPFTPADIGLVKWMFYSSIGIIIHHSYLFIIDSHSFNAPLLLIWRIIISTIASSLLLTSVVYFAKPQVER